MPDEPSDPEESAPTPPPFRALLDPRVRLVLGLAGGVLLGIASYVVFTGKDGTATAALLGVALVLVVFAGQGRPIRSVKQGGVEVLLEEAIEQKQLGNTQKAQELVGAALSIADLSPSVSVESAGRLHEFAVLNALQRVMPENAQLRLTATPVDALL